MKKCYSYILYSALVISVVLLVVFYSIMLYRKHISDNICIRLKNNLTVMCNDSYSSNIDVLVRQIDDSLRSDISVSDISKFNGSNDCEYHDIGKYAYQVLKACKEVYYCTNGCINPTLKPYIDKLDKTKNKSIEKLNSSMKTVFDQQKENMRFDCIIFSNDKLKRLKKNVYIDLDKFIGACQVENISSALTDENVMDYCVGCKDCFVVHGNQQNKLNGWNIQKSIKTKEGHVDILFKNLQNKAVSILSDLNCNSVVNYVRIKRIRNILKDRLRDIEKDINKGKISHRQNEYLMMSNELLHFGGKKYNDMVEMQELVKNKPNYECKTFEYLSIDKEVLETNGDYLWKNVIVVPTCRLSNLLLNHDIKFSKKKCVSRRLDDHLPKRLIQYRHKYVKNVLKWDTCYDKFIVKCKANMFIQKEDCKGDGETLINIYERYNSKYRSKIEKYNTDKLVHRYHNLMKQKYDGRYSAILSRCCTLYDTLSRYFYDNVRYKIKSAKPKIDKISKKRYKFFNWIIDTDNGKVVDPLFACACIISDTPLLAKGFIDSFSTKNFLNADRYSKRTRYNTCEYVVFYRTKTGSVMYRSSDGISVKSEGKNFVISTNN